MNEEKNVIDGQEDPPIQDGVDYIKVINDLKKTTVSKDQYNKLKEENERLLDSLINGDSIHVDKDKPVDINDLRKTLFNDTGKTMTNLEYVSTALKLRSALIAAGEKDPFLPHGDKVSITPDQIDAAEQAAQVFQECVNFADGDSGIFTAELQRRTKDVSPIFSKRR